MMNQVRRAGHRLELRLGPGIQMDSYPGPLGQVLINFVNNALLHAFEGRARADGAVRRAATPGQVRIEFADDGRGIPPEHLSRVFDPFFTTRMGQGGTGLGLNIAYNIVTKRLGGSVLLDNVQPHGARFTVTLPKQAQTAKRRAKNVLTPDRPARTAHGPSTPEAPGGPGRRAPLRPRRQPRAPEPAGLRRSIQAAEAELGLQLFDRGIQEITCTSAGQFVIERARKLLFDSRCLERDVDLYRERLLGDLYFGVGPFPAVALVPGLIIELRTRYPGINSRVEVNNWRYLLEHLRAEELDFFVADVRNVPPAHDLHIDPIGQQPAGFYVRSGHPVLALRKEEAGAA